MIRRYATPVTLNKARTRIYPTKQITNNGFDYKISKTESFKILWLTNDSQRQASHPTKPNDFNMTSQMGRIHILRKYDKYLVTKVTKYDAMLYDSLPTYQQRRHITRHTFIYNLRNKEIMQLHKLEIYYRT